MSIFTDTSFTNENNNYAFLIREIRVYDMFFNQ